MACIENIYSVSALVGSNKCNANCSFCAAKSLRPEASVNDKMPETFKSALKLSARYGGWSLSLTGSGEPTCSPDAVTNALKDYQDCASQGAYYPNVNLFTNGILLGDDDFCEKYLPLWKSLGLTAIAVSIHEIEEERQRQIYNIDEYPLYSTIFRNIHKHGLQCRATLLLRKGGIDSVEKLHRSIKILESHGVRNISSWCIGNQNGSRNKYTPSRISMIKIRYWIHKNMKKCHGHVWGGGVYDFNGTLFRLTDYVTEHKPNKNFVRQLVVFQNGDVCYSWIKEGALCFKI